MNLRQFVEALRREGFDADPRSEYHIQIILPNKKKHDIWYSSGIKLKLAGHAKAQSVRFETLLKMLHSYDHSKSDFSQAQDACKMITALSQRADREGCWVDAGFKHGKARAAAILVKKNYIQSHVVFFDTAQTSHQAEKDAVNLGKTKFPGEPIYTDCKALHDPENGVTWVPREQNRAADKLANLRGKDVSPKENSPADHSS